MTIAGTGILIWPFGFQDLYSYNMEQAMGHTGNNILTVLMQEKDIDLQTASDLVGDHFKVLIDRFLSCKAQLPSWGPEWDDTVSQFVMAMESWIIGNLEWSFETQRYFGPYHAKIKETLIVELYPKRV